MSRPTPWPAPVAPAPVDATVRVPGSKSLTARWLVLAALGDGPTTIRHPLHSQDSAAMVGALRALGCTVEADGPEVLRVVPPVDGFRGGVDIDCGQAGTVMRFVPPLAALADGPVRFHGHPSAGARPVGPLLDALRDLGIDVDDTEEGAPGALPFTVHGRGDSGGPTGAGDAPAPSRVSMDASASSQFVSALLLAGARLPGGLELTRTGDRVPSRPHLLMTERTLAAVGVEVEHPTERSWRIAPGAVSACDVTVDPDLSTAAPFLALAAATGGTVRIPDWPDEETPDAATQPGAHLPDLLAAFGATARLVEGTLQVTGPAPGILRPVDLDLSEVGELTPVLAALATLAPGRSRLRGIAHLRGHETDRLAALVTEITRLGAGARETDDGLEIDGLAPADLPTGPVVLDTYHDHRMAMFGAVVGAVRPGTALADVGVTAKTHPDFPRAWIRAVEGGRH